MFRRRHIAALALTAAILAIAFGLPSVLGAQTPAREPQETPIMLNAGDGARNHGFETWVEGEPLFWAVDGGSRQKLSRNTDNPPKGESALAISGNHSWFLVKQRIHMYGPIAGKTLRLSVRAKSSDPGSAACAIAPNAGDIATSKRHPGDGQWHELVANFKIPKNAPPSYVDIHLGSSRSPKHETLFDDVRLVIE